MVKFEKVNSPLYFLIVMQGLCLLSNGNVTVKIVYIHFLFIATVKSTFAFTEVQATEVLL